MKSLHRFRRNKKTSLRNFANSLASAKKMEYYSIRLQYGSATYNNTPNYLNIVAGNYPKSVFFKLFHDI